MHMYTYMYICIFVYVYVNIYKQYIHVNIIWREREISAVQQNILQRWKPIIYTAQ